jgi:hypothetical protein
MYPSTSLCNFQQEVLLIVNSDEPLMPMDDTILGE